MVLVGGFVLHCLKASTDQHPISCLYIFGKQYFIKSLYLPVIFNSDFAQYSKLSFTTSSLEVDTFEQVLWFEFPNIQTSAKRPFTPKPFGN